MQHPFMLAAVVAALVPATAAQGFVDATAEVGLALPFAPELGETALDEAGFSGGFAVGDFDGDGWDDVFAHAGVLGVNRLHRNDGDGTFTDVAAAVGLDASMPGADAKFADYDGDGDLDLYLTTYRDYATDGGRDAPRNWLCRSAGGALFQDVTVASGLLDSGHAGSTWGDVDGDGLLDLATVSWKQPDPTLIWRNNGDGTFVDVTPAWMKADLVHGFAPTLLDYDEDGDADLLLAGDFGTSRVYRNDGAGAWTDLSQTVLDGGPLTDENGMGSCFGDIDNDGDMDWYVTSIWMPPHVNPPGWSSKTGNRMYRSNGDGTFTDFTEVSGTRYGGWGWGAEFGDLDNDGDVDLVEVNGFLISAPSWDPWIVYDPLRVYDNDGTGVFTDVALDLGIDDTNQNRGVALFDPDRDGDLDILVQNWDVGLTYYRNDRPDLGAWIEVELRGADLNRFGVGARIEAVSDGTPSPTQVRWMLAGDNYMSQSPLREHFGLGDATTVTVNVTWPGGDVVAYADLALDQRHVLYQAGPWEDLGSSLAGTGGLAPTLVGDGTMAANSVNRLEFADMVPDSIVYLMLGLTNVSVPFKGGTLVPSLFIPPLALPTGPAGKLPIQFDWPAGVPMGVRLYWQGWVVDPGGPKGFAATNAITVKTP